jgi:hypothetical protein
MIPTPAGLLERFYFISYGNGKSEQWISRYIEYLMIFINLLNNLIFGEIKWLK